MEQSPIPSPDFRLLFESGGACLVLNPDHIIVAVSDAYLRLTRTTRNQLQGRNFFEAIPDTLTAVGFEKLRASLARVVSTGSPDTMAVERHDIPRPETEGGFEEHYWRLVHAPVLAADGRLLFIIHRLEDVTDLARQQRRLGSDEPGPASRELQELNRRLRQENAELRRARAELERNVIDRTARLTEVNEELRAEIHEHRQTERTLRENERRLRGFFEATTVGMVEVSREVQILRANDAFCRMLGRPAGEVVRRPVTDFVFAEDREGVLGQYERLWEGADAFEADRRYRRKDGSVLWARVSGFAVRDESGRVECVAGVVIDLTERRRLEEQFHQAQKMEAVGRLAGGVAHDFNNLLTIINGNGQILLDRLPKSDPARDQVQEMTAAGERAAALTAQLLAFSRQAVVEPRILDLNDIVSQSARLLRRLIGEDVLLTTALEPGLARIRADPAQIEQVLLNLAVNAKDAMPHGGQLTIETRSVRLRDGDAARHPGLAPGDFVQLIVSDTGTGMTEVVKGQLFEPFFTTKEPGKGTGLGLAVVHGAVRQNGGRIDVDSEFGAGTRFRILLPAATTPTATPTTSPSRLAPRGAETVLLVEDEEAVRKLGRIALEAQGYTVLVSATGAEALALARLYPDDIHLVVTDVVMPGMGGREVAEKLRAARPTLKVLYVSGYTDDAIVRHGVLAAADAFLHKPFTPLALARKVRAVLDAP